MANFFIPKDAHTMFWNLCKIKFQICRFLFLELWSFLYSLKSPQLSLNFHDNSKNINRKTDFSFNSAHCAPFMKAGSKLQGEGGGVVRMKLVETEPALWIRFAKISVSVWIRPVHYECRIEDRICPKKLNEYISVPANNTNTFSTKYLSSHREKTSRTTYTMIDQLKNKAQD